MTDTAAAGLVRAAAVPLAGPEGEWDALLDLIGDARLVLLGEATHGTQEFYRARAEITKRLIREKGFTAVAVEADWPDAYRVNHYVRGQGDDANADAALGSFERFPTWMWRNTEVVRLVDWLRAHNRSLASGEPMVGFYGVDLYSLYGSIEAVVRYLETVDPEAASRARQRYACFEHTDEPQIYGHRVELGITESCQDEAVRQLTELRGRAAELASRHGALPEDEHFYAEQNARLVLNAEEYYREMFRGSVSSWNLRDCHMADTIDALLRHFSGKGQSAKIVVWEHNSHLGDASATEMGRQGEWNVGQLVRERHGDDARLIGFSTYTGTVTAAHDWDGPAERMRVRPGMAGSWEALFHDTGIPNFLLPLRGGDDELRRAMSQERLERAIGVIYRPRTERQSHYFGAAIAHQFDAVIHFDETTALTPLGAPPESGDEGEWVREN
ncbi:MAG TPA: erythromycin esterase family protein [Longimicrobium sp.]|nr:erythromycin esterase family protein [Longimicrobium sp.]